MFLFYLVCWKHCESQDWSWPGFLWHTIWWRSLFPLLELLTVHSHSSVCDLSRPMLLHQQPVLVPQQPYFVTEWPTQLFSHCLWILTVSFLLLWKNNNCWQLVQHLTAYTFHIHSYTRMCIFGCTKLRLFFDPLVQKLTCMPKTSEICVEMLDWHLTESVLWLWGLIIIWFFCPHL